MGASSCEFGWEYAKQALDVGVSIHCQISKSEAKSIIKQSVKKLWQEAWDREDKGRDLYRVCPEVGLGHQGKRCRKEEVILNRLRIGHTGLNKSLHVIGKHDTGHCDSCDVLETVEHVLTKCSKYDRERQLVKRKIEDAMEVFNLNVILAKGTDHVVIKYLF